MGLTYSHGREFVRQLRPILQRRDVDGLIRHLHQHWTNAQLCEMLTTGHDDAVKTALVCLCVTGTIREERAIVRLLHCEDQKMAALAEHALWSIWFQAGDAEANRQLMQAVRFIAEQRFGAAIECLDHIVSQHPMFAEAYNQRAIARFFTGHYALAAADCEHALRLNRDHFGALAGLGHCYASLGRLHDALRAYRRALAVHPRLEGIRESIRQVRKYIDQSETSSNPWITEA